MELGFGTLQVTVLDSFSYFGHVFSTAQDKLAKQESYDSHHVRREPHTPLTPHTPTTILFPTDDRHAARLSQLMFSRHF
jgi:hypothetical protein